MWVNTSVRQTSGGFVGTLGSNCGFVQAAAGPNNTPYSGAPLNQLYVRQLSRDRNINDITLENQTEVEAKFHTGPIGHLLLMGLDLNYEQYTNKTYTRSGSCNGIPLVAGSVGCTPAGFTVGAGTPGNVAVDPGQLRLVAGLGSRRLFQRHDPGHALAEAGRRPALGRLFGAVRQLGQLGEHGRQHRGALPVPDRLLHQRPRRRDLRADKEQSYYVSYSTSFNPSLEQLTSTTGSQSLPPENNEGYEAGVKYEFMNGNLSTNAAVFQITKNNARTANADGTFSPTGTVRVKGVRVGAAGRITPEWQVFAGYAYLDARIIQGITNIGGVGNTTGMVPLNTPQGFGQHLDDLHDQGHLRDRRRHVLCRPALRQQPEHRAGAGVFPLRR